MGEFGAGTSSSSRITLQIHACALALTAGMLLYTLWQNWTNRSSSSSSSNRQCGVHSCGTEPLQKQQRQQTGEPTCSLTAAPPPAPSEAKAAAAAAAAAAAEVSRLQRVYRDLAVAFEQRGLDAAAIASTARWFDTTGSEAVAPMFYQDPSFPPNPLPPAAVRLLLVLLSEAVPAAPAAADTQLTAAAAVAASADSEPATPAAPAAAAAVAADMGPTAADTELTAAAAVAAPADSEPAAAAALDTEPTAAAADTEPTTAAAAAASAARALNNTAIEAAVSITDQVQALLPAGCKVFANPPAALHITLFHFSHPLDTRPHTLPLEHPSNSSSRGQDVVKHEQQQQSLVYEISADTTTAAAEAAAQEEAGTAGDKHACRQQQQQQQQSVLSLPAHLRPGPTQQQQSAELAAAAAVAAATQPFTLQLERVFMTVTGTLLLGWSDPSGTVARLRQDLAAAFPGASSKQSNIIHTSLLRIVTTTAATPQCCQQQDEAGVSLAAGSGGGKPQQQQQQQQQEERQLDEAGLSLAAGSGGGNPLRQQEQQEQQLPAAVVAAVGELCERLTQQHRGLRVSVGQLHWTIEEQFSTVQGSQVAAPLAPVAPQLCGAQPAAP